MFKFSFEETKVNPLLLLPVRKIDLEIQNKWMLNIVLSRYKFLMVECSFFNPSCHLHLIFETRSLNVSFIRIL